MELATLALLVTVSGYGDVNDEGYPNDEERWLILWTNAARVAPAEFEDDYAMGNCSTDDFSEDELTPKEPLYIDLDLTEAARYHSQDMNDNGCFQHESCDGTDTWTRIDRFYDDASGTMGENIAYGGSDARFSVLSMWMCSTSGHRANIMEGAYNEMGGGVVNSYMTQDFAQGELKEGDPPMRMGADKNYEYLADWGDDEAPARISVVRDGLETPLELEHGEPELGLYGTVMPEEADVACHETYWLWETAGGEQGTFPEDGSFTDGDCEDEYGWIDSQIPLEGGGEDGGEFSFGCNGGAGGGGKDLADDEFAVSGCASAPLRAGGWVFAVAGLVALARRRGR